MVGVALHFYSSEKERERDAAGEAIPGKRISSFYNPATLSFALFRSINTSDLLVSLHRISYSILQAIQLVRIRGETAMGLFCPGTIKRQSDGRCKVDNRSAGHVLYLS